MSFRSSAENLQQSNAGDDPVAIRLYARSVDAALDVATLESHGIAAEIMGDTVGDTLNWYGLAVQKVELIVPRQKAAASLKILAELSTRRSENQRLEWVCSGCSEVNGNEFDSCWSCGKIWSAEHDEEFVPANLAQPLPTEHDPIYFLPEQDANPYAPPVAGTVVSAAPGIAVESEIQRAFRSLILSMFFPPLALYTFFLVAQTLSRISRNDLAASTTQIRKLRWIMIATIVAVPFLLTTFGMLL